VAFFWTQNRMSRLCKLSLPSCEDGRRVAQIWLDDHSSAHRFVLRKALVHLFFLIAFGTERRVRSLRSRKDGTRRGCISGGSRFLRGGEALVPSTLGRVAEGGSDEPLSGISACAKLLGKPLLVRSPHTATAPIVELA
jgi:hypothetical protein